MESGIYFYFAENESCNSRCGRPFPAMQPLSTFLAKLFIPIGDCRSEQWQMSLFDDELRIVNWDRRGRFETGRPLTVRGGGWTLKISGTALLILKGGVAMNRSSWVLSPVDDRHRRWRASFMQRLQQQ